MGSAKWGVQIGECNLECANWGVQTRECKLGSAYWGRGGRWQFGECNLGSANKVWGVQFGECNLVNAISEVLVFVPKINLSSSNQRFYIRLNLSWTIIVSFGHGI